MSKKILLIAALTFLSLLQTIPSSWAAVNKPSSQAQKNQASKPKKDDKNNLSVGMEGHYVLGVNYVNCAGVSTYEKVGQGSTMNRCAKEGTEVSAIVSGSGDIPIYFNKSPLWTYKITVSNKGISMKCSGWFWYSDPPRCDASTPYEMQ